MLLRIYWRYGMEVKILSVNDTIGLVHFNGLLSLDECAELIAIGSISDAKPSVVVDGASDAAYETPGRCSTVVAPDNQDRNCIFSA